MISTERRQEIEGELAAMEQREGVRILLAVESGSRAWGFPSADSDYDVRIVYAHPRDWYLSVFEGRDVIEQPISGDLDIAGWDLRKTLRLLTGGNAVVHEWLGSPIVYRERQAEAAVLRELAQAAFDPRAAFHHYLAMAAKKLDVAEGEAITAKRFLYGLRTLLCARWVAERRTAPPMLFSELLAAFVSEGSAERADIERLVQLKAGGSEKDIDASLGELLAWGWDMVRQVKAGEAPPAHKLEGDVLDRGFRRLLEIA